MYIYTKHGQLIYPLLYIVYNIQLRKYISTLIHQVTFVQSTLDITNLTSFTVDAKTKIHIHRDLVNYCHHI